MERQKITVLVAGYPALCLTWLPESLREQCIELAGGIDSYARLLAAMTAAPIDLLVLDRDLPGLGDLAGLPAVHAARPMTRVLLTGGPLHNGTLTGALRYGVRGLIVKPGHTDEYLKAIDAIRDGDIWFPRRALADAVMDLVERFGAGKPNDIPTGEWTVLTVREREIAAWLTHGMTNKEIARKLGVSEKTVKAHLSNMFQKMKVHRRINIALGQNGARRSRQAGLTTNI